MSVQPSEAHTTDGLVADGGGAVVHQALRREVNESISALNQDFHVAAPELIDVMCECVHLNCTEHVSMTLAAYEAIRRFPTHFVVKAGHEVAEGERIVSDALDHVVVEKSGRDGIYAVSADPRRRSHLSNGSVGA